MEGIKSKEIIVITATIEDDGRISDDIYEEQLVLAKAEVKKLKPNLLYEPDLEYKSDSYESGCYVFTWEVEL
jgi:hypothetical protein